MEIVIKGDILDFVDEYELREEVKSQIKYQIKNIFMEDADIKSAVISTIVNEVKDIKFTEEVKNKLQERFEQIVRKDYLTDETDWNIKYDTGMRDKIQKLFDENYEETYSHILKKQIDNAVNNYQPDNYMIADVARSVMLKDEKCVEILKEALEERMLDIIEKI